MWHLILLPPFIHRLRKKQQAPVLHANTQPPTAFHMSEMKPYIFHDLFSLHILASITFLPNWIVHGSAEQKENNEKKMENGCKKIASLHVVFQPVTCEQKREGGAVRCPENWVAWWQELNSIERKTCKRRGSTICIDVQFTA